MRICNAFAILGIAALSAGQAVAATVDVGITGKDGKPLADAVVTLTAAEGSVASHISEHAVIDQRHETFVPLVTILRRGGRVTFANNDTTMHQVYSFSPLKQFQFVVGQGQTSEPVQFDRAGIVAIGCNIHDQMIAYAFVSDAAFAIVTDQMGHAAIADVPSGRYRVALWHPQLPFDTTPSEISLEVGSGTVSFTGSLPVVAEPPHGMKHMHMAY
jgi:plastocyanin